MFNCYKISKHIPSPLYLGHDVCNCNYSIFATMWFLVTVESDKPNVPKSGHPACGLS